MKKKFTKRFDQLPESVKKAVKLIQMKLQPSRIVLFGSRARGDARENSDYDLCVVDAIMGGARSEVRVMIDEDPITLYKVDLLFFEELGQDYLTNISKEGVDLYG